MPREAFFSHDTTSVGVQGFGSHATSTVPEPGRLALLLAALGALGFAARRR